MHDVGSKQKGRKLQVLKNKAQCALWFMKSFGRENSQIKLKDEDGSNYSFDYAVDHGTSSNVCPNDIKERVEQILFLWTNSVFAMRSIMNLLVYQMIYQNHI